MLCEVQVIKRAAHYGAFAHSCLSNYRNIKTTTLNLKCMSFLFRMFSKHYCKVELEAKFARNLRPNSFLIWQFCSPSS